MKNYCIVSTFIFGILLLSVSLSAAEKGVRLTKSDMAAIDIFIDGKLFTSYQYSIGFVKPIFYPIISVGGNWINRGYPIRNDIAGESHDHWHKKSLWFTYGNVNGVDFWSESAEQKEGGIGESGKIRHTGFTAMESSESQGKLGYTADWIEPYGHIVLKQKTDVIFTYTGKSRSMDFTITLTAQDKPVIFNDTKEGMFGIRYNTDLHEKNGGKYINANGQEGENGVWGKRANWVALRGKIKDEPMVLAIFDHPSSVNHPTWWHARGYGLFALNPFGKKDFEKDAQPLNVTIKPGESLTFKYLVTFFSGTLSKEELDTMYKNYTGQK
ncbi:MAG: PmoA family protein [Patescibacteria group bacterium]|nr:PmoA family protein [Patescibacteria group bacterium]